MGENIGMCARAMLNFGLSELRLVSPRDGWPNAAAIATAADADAVLEGARVFPDLRSAIADCTAVYATTARSRALELPVWEGDEIRDVFSESESAGDDSRRLGVLFGAEASGLTNEQVALATGVFTFATNPQFPSLNLAQAVLLVASYWSSCQVVGNPREGSPVAPHAAVYAWLDRLFFDLEERGFFLSQEQRPAMEQQLQVLLSRAAVTDRELKILHGVLTALTADRK